jgi:carbon-monoxide dehydrogenase small subunit
MQKTLRFTLNGKRVEITTDGERKLLWVLRTDLGLTGTKCGCAKGQCGACTVLVDNQAQRSCLVSLEDVAGKRVTTIEGLAPRGKLHPVQQAFVEYGALQCGFCTPGMILTIVDLLKRTPNPSEAQIREGLEGNMCRCGAHQRIIQAVQAAAKRMR